MGSKLSLPEGQAVTSILAYQLPPEWGSWNLDQGSSGDKIQKEKNLLSWSLVLSQICTIPIKFRFNQYKKKKKYQTQN